MDIPIAQAIVQKIISASSIFVHSYKRRFVAGLGSTSCLGPIGGNYSFLFCYRSKRKFNALATPSQWLFSCPETILKPDDLRIMLLALFNVDKEEIVPFGKDGKTIKLSLDYTSSAKKIHGKIPSKLRKHLSVSLVNASLSSEEQERSIELMKKWGGADPEAESSKTGEAEEEEETAEESEDEFLTPAKKKKATTKK
jgi:hypothetical protein